MLPRVSTLTVVEDLPIREVTTQLTRLQAKSRVLFARLDQQGDYDPLPISCPSECLHINRARLPLDHHGVLTLAADSTRQGCASSDVYA